MNESMDRFAIKIVPLKIASCTIPSKFVINVNIKYVYIQKPGGKQSN